MLVNQLLLINRLAINISFGRNFEAHFHEPTLDQRLSRRQIGMGLDEDKGTVPQKTRVARVGRGRRLFERDERGRHDKEKQVHGCQ